MCFIANVREAKIYIRYVPTKYILYMFNQMDMLFAMNFIHVGWRLFPASVIF